MLLAVLAFWLGLPLVFEYLQLSLLILATTPYDMTHTSDELDMQT